MPKQVQIRRDTAALWTSIDPTLAQGELGMETDTGKLKIGNGTTTWKNLTYLATTVSPPDWSSVTQEARIQSSDIASGDNLSYDVDISTDGNTVAVGALVASSDSQKGAAYIFTRSGTIWSQEAKLQPSDVASSDYAGTALSISGDGNTLVIGARGHDGGQTNAGAAYIFTRSGTTWSQEAKLVASSQGQYYNFGVGVAISTDGDTVVVGSDGDATGGTSAGSAYVFTRSGTTWSQQAYIQCSDRAANDLFGQSIALSDDGNYAAIGVKEKSGGGAAYVFTRSGTTWSQQAKIVSSDLQTGDAFGVMIDISDDGATVIVGANNEDTGATSAGSAYVFTRSGTSWSQQAKLQASDKEIYDQFGISAKLDKTGDLAIVGAWLEDTDYSNAGAAYVFTRDGTTWSQQSKITATDSTKASGDNFGITLAICSNTAIVGSWYVDGKGAAYIFTA